MRKNRKTGQLLSQPLVFAFALIVGALILVFGGKIVYDLIAETECVDVYDSMNDLENEIELFKHFDEGSTKKITLTFPAEIKYVCFYSRDMPENCKLDGRACELEDIEDGFSLLLEGTDANLFLFPSNICDITHKNIGSIKTKDANPLCVASNREVRITSKAGYVEVAYP